MGFSDLSTREEIVSPDEIIGIIEKLGIKKQQGFSIIRAKGAYSHLIGEMTFENSIILRMIGWSEEDAAAVARSLKMYLNQESVIVNQREIGVEYI